MKTNNGGKKHTTKRSGLEDLVEHLLTHHGLAHEYETHNLQYLVPPTKRRYRPDFPLLGNWKHVYLESKGRFTAGDRKKMVLIKEQYPTLVFIMVFGRSENTLSRVSKTTYGQWCDKNGILWCDIDEFKVDPKKCITRLLKENKNQNAPT